MCQQVEDDERAARQILGELDSGSGDLEHGFHNLAWRAFGKSERKIKSSSPQKLQVWHLRLMEATDTIFERVERFQQDANTDPVAQRSVEDDRVTYAYLAAIDAEIVLHLNSLKVLVRDHQ